MNEFEHERLDVYKAAIELLVLADAVASTLPRGRGYLADQLRRAASSISFNIAEGAGEFAVEEKARFYRQTFGDRVRGDPRRLSGSLVDDLPIVRGGSCGPSTNRRDANRDGEEIGLGLGLGLGLSRDQPIKSSVAKY